MYRYFPNFLKLYYLINVFSLSFRDERNESEEEVVIKQIQIFSIFRICHRTAIFYIDFVVLYFIAWKNFIYNIFEKKNMSCLVSN